MALLFSFFYALPVTWVYRWTRPRKKYNPDLVHTLLVVPIAISLVVFLVKDSIALAFSLAGHCRRGSVPRDIEGPPRCHLHVHRHWHRIVGWYRYRSSGYFGLGGFQCRCFGHLAHELRGEACCPVRVQAGASRQVVARCRSGTQAGKIPKSYNAKLRVHTAQVEAAQQAAVALLATYAKRWRQVRIVQQEDSTAIVEFDVRLKKTADPAAFTRELEKSTEGHTVKVELEL